MAKTRLVHIMAALASLWAILKKLNHAGSSFWLPKPIDRCLGRQESFATSLPMAGSRTPKRHSAVRGDFQT